MTTPSRPDAQAARSAGQAAMFPTARSLEARLRAAAATAGAAPAVLDASGVRATHDDLRRIRDGGRQFLREAGVGRTDRIALIMPSDWRLAVSLLAAMSACAVVALDPTLTDRELTAYLAQLRPRLVLTDTGESARRLRALAGAGTGVLEWSAGALDGPPDDDEPGREDPALLLFTSGTTAAPKMAELSQRNVAAGADSIAGTLRLGPGDRALNTMSLHHGHGIFPGTLAPLVAGGSTLCHRPGSAEELLAAVQSAAPTWYSAAPVMHHSILAMTRSMPAIREALALRVIRSTSSALSAELLSRLESALGAPVVEAYALSEAPGQIASNPLNGPRKPGSVGIPQDTEIVLRTDDGDVTDAPGSVGEVLVRGPNVMPGYLDTAESEQPFLDGWLRTGDRARFDEDGYLAISGRVSEIINRGAEKISPAEVEVVLAEHPAVREAVAYGRPHPTLGEEPAVAVVVHEGASTTEHELIAFAAQRLATYKVPVSVQFVPAMPRGRTGKVVRRRLREQSERLSADTRRRMVPPR